MNGRLARAASLAALIALSAGVVQIERSTHVRGNGDAVIAVGLLVTWSFGVAGLIASRRRPENRTGPLMIAIGFAWLLAALTDSPDDLVYTAGLVLSAMWPGLLVYLLLAYPSGRLDRPSRLVVGLAFADTIGLSLLLLPFTDPQKDFPDSSAQSARNLALVDHHHDLVTATNLGSIVVAVPLIAALLVLVWRRWRAASPAGRRVLAPLYLTGAVAVLVLLGFAIASSVEHMSSDIPFYAFSIAFAAVPIGYLAGILRTRFDRSGSIGLLVGRLREQRAAGGVRDALREALNDPTLELAYRRADSDEYVDVFGDPFPLEEAARLRSVRIVERDGSPVAAVVHDPTLLEDPELVDAVCGAAALAIDNERLHAELRAQIQEVGASERRLRGLLENVQLIAVTVDVEGRITFCNRFLCDLTGWTREELLGRRWAEVFNPASTIAEQIVAGWVSPHDEQRVRTRDGGVVQIAWSTTLDRDADGRAVGATGIGQDVTERNRALRELRQVALQQAALRRVATAVAATSEPEDVFDLVCEEVARLLGGRAAAMVRFDLTADAGVVVGGWTADGYEGMPLGTEMTFDGPTTVARVARTGHSARVDDYRDLEGEYAARVRALGFNAAVAAPITVDGRLAGAIVVSTVEGEPLPADAEERIAEFAELVALGLANAEARAELARSRERIVTAGDAERRRLERNLHDGAQQRLVSLSVALRMVAGSLDDREHAARLLNAASDELQAALEELRELARGIHPAVLTDFGLEAALNALIQRPSGVPVELDIELNGRLEPPVEAAIYYVASEALANVVKHSGASQASVVIRQDDARVVLQVVDDGVGGADWSRGGGLRGLGDRLAVLGGEISVSSPPGLGTTVTASVPLVPRPAGRAVPVG